MQDTLTLAIGAKKSVHFIRRSNPRADTRFQPLDNRRIMRRGISFGPEMTKEEQTSGTTHQGLLFACYQASIEDTFQFIQNSGYYKIS